MSNFAPKNFRLYLFFCFTKETKNSGHYKCVPAKKTIPPIHQPSLLYAFLLSYTQSRPNKVPCLHTVYCSSNSVTLN